MDSLNHPGERMFTKTILFASTLCIALTFDVNAQSSVETPSGLIYTKNKPQLEFEHLKTYASDPDQAGALPTDIFPRSTTTYVYGHIEFKNLLHNVRNHEYKLTFKYYLESGERLGEFSTTYTVEKDWEYAWYYDSWGWDTPGKWPLGTHALEVWVDDTKFAVKKFTVTSN